MKTSKETQRAWLYARVPGNYIETKNTLNVLMLQAQRDGAEVVGWGYDIHHGWLRRPAYRRMMREAKAGHIERIYICRMAQWYLHAHLDNRPEHPLPNEVQGYGQSRWHHISSRRVGRRWNNR